MFQSGKSCIIAVYNFFFKIKKQSRFDFSQFSSEAFTFFWCCYAGIGVVVIIASVMLWTGRYMTGGVINLVLGIITIFYGKDSEGIVVLISGVLGVIAPKIKD